MSPIENTRTLSQARDLLGVGQNVTERELKTAWKKLAFEMHPDRGLGTDDQLANINAAYSLLREGCANDASKVAQANQSPVNKSRYRANTSRPVESEPAPVRPVRPRPAATTRSTVFSPELRAECKSLISDEEPGHGHIVRSVERMGRRLTYRVRSELAEGENCVAVPTGELVDPRHMKPTTVRFVSDEGGSGRLELPDHLREASFPGATQVVILFGEEET
ncbi:MAG: J domain-containing protein [Boseongicola sp.]|nr:J domain-containing protein [Boseongicola sp.]MDD9977198.1 J domain-containing protein [Boseongicola sp.]